LKICEKCGKANDVTRKYCTRCGASLLKSADTPASKPSIAIPEVGRVVTGADIERSRETEHTISAQTTIASDEDRDVRPSEVSPDRMRTADRHIEKTEFEKAQETFVSSETANPDERMLRASEIREIEDEIYTESLEKHPSENSRIDSLGETATPEPVEDENDEGREVVKDILERVKAAEARAHGEEIVHPPESDIETQEAPSEPFESATPETPRAASSMEPLDDSTLVPPQDVSVGNRESVSPITTVALPVDDQARDEKLRLIESDMKALAIEHNQLASELHSLQARLDEEVERYRIVAETKRTRTEGIERELKLAKKEYDDANKEFKNAENRRKKELSDAEKRINEVEKRTKKAEDAKQKRIQDLEKERLKREEEATGS
jgi:hypothetical protein